MPGLSDRFRHDFKRALRFANALGAQHLHLMAGKAQGVVARKTYLDNLAWAAAQAPKTSLTIEPINPHDMPGYFLNDFDQAADILDEIGAPNLGLQFDMYHAQMITHDGMAVWEKHGGRAKHIQVGGVPGRGEPVKGEIEYNPVKQTAAGLSWMSPVGS